MRIVTNVFIAFFLAIALTDSFPFLGKRLETLREAIDPVIDVFGIWQGRWNLFCPDVDKQNHHIEVQFHLKGEEAPAIWKSPDWSTMSCLAKFRHSRSIEFYDQICSEENPLAWKSYTRFLANEYLKREPGSDLFRIEVVSVVDAVRLPRLESGEEETARTTIMEAEISQ
jgi:hypothetical protein